MSDLQNICVYCASSNAVEPKYKDLAGDVGVMLAQKGRILVYGGGHVGLMGAAADAALGEGGEVIGVIPQYLKDKEVAHTGLTHLYVTENLQTRQTRMAELSDAFIVLPGGLGTLAEFFEILTWKQLGLHDKPILVLNADGYWNSLLGAVSEAFEAQFLYQNPDLLFTVCHSMGDLEEMLG